MRGFIISLLRRRTQISHPAANIFRQQTQIVRTCQSYHHAHSNHTDVTVTLSVHTVKGVTTLMGRILRRMDREEHITDFIFQTVATLVEIRKKRGEGNLCIRKAVPSPYCQPRPLSDRTQSFKQIRRQQQRANSRVKEDARPVDRTGGITVEKIQRKYCEVRTPLSHMPHRGRSSQRTLCGLQKNYSRIVCRC